MDERSYFLNHGKSVTHGESSSNGVFLGQAFPAETGLDGQKRRATHGGSPLLPIEIAET
jgi:hypothetical protein